MLRVMQLMPWPAIGPMADEIEIMAVEEVWNRAVHVLSAGGGQRRRISGRTGVPIICLRFDQYVEHYDYLRIRDQFLQEG